MLLSPGEILSALSYYKYWIIFPIAIFEGPIICVISGFLVSMGSLNGFVVYMMLVLADTLGDLMYYSIGRFWRHSDWLKKHANFFGYSEKSEEYLQNHFSKHKAKTFLLAKISHGLGSSVQIASGIAKVNYKEFLLWSVVGTVPKVLVLLILGYYVGSSYENIDNYLQFMALLAVGTVCLLVMYFVLSKHLKKYLI
ncbi:MAG: VTT domain-containing protein [Parcubacteria group bacterium]